MEPESGPAPSLVDWSGGNEPKRDQLRSNPTLTFIVNFHQPTMDPNRWPHRPKQTRIDNHALPACNLHIAAAY